MSEVSLLINPTRKRNNLTCRARRASLALQFLTATLALIPKQAALATATPGGLVAWGDQAFPYIEPGTHFVKLAAGHSHNLALKQDRTVVAWGYNHSGRATVPVGLNNVVSIAAGGSHNLVLKQDGIVVGWGYNDVGQTKPPAGLSNVVAIAGGYYHSLALKQDGTLLGWGVDVNIQPAVPLGLSNVVAIAAGSAHNLAVVQPLAYRPTTLSAKISGGRLIFSWPAIPGRRYRLQHKSTLDEAVWTDLPGDFAALDNSATASDAVSTTARFYQLVLLP